MNRGISFSEVSDALAVYAPELQTAQSKADFALRHADPPRVQTTVKALTARSGQYPDLAVKRSSMAQRRCRSVAACTSAMAAELGYSLRRVRRQLLDVAVDCGDNLVANCVADGGCPTEDRDGAGPGHGCVVVQRLERFLCRRGQRGRVGEQ